MTPFEKRLASLRNLTRPVYQVICFIGASTACENDHLFATLKTAQVNMIHPSDNDYRLTKKIKEGITTMDPGFVELADCIQNRLPAPATQYLIRHIWAGTNAAIKHYF